LLLLLPSLPYTIQTHKLLRQQLLLLPCLLQAG
jgi:hypothetical protein